MEKPTVTVKLENAEKWVVEIGVEAMPNLDLALAMLGSAARALDAKLKDMEAIEFQQKMQQAAQAQRAMSKPLIVKPQ